VRTLVAVATGSGFFGIRVLTGVVLAIFIVVYAALGLLLLPVVATGLGIAALPSRGRAIARRLPEWTIGARLAIRSVFAGLLSLGR
jgi:hypothetical protein